MKMKFKPLYILFWIVLIIPIAYGILLSYPTYDDFDLFYYVQGRFSLTEAVGQTARMYKNWQGDWFASFWQFLINPLLFFSYKGIGYGAEMLVLTGLFFGCFIYFVATVLEVVMKVSDKAARRWIVLAVTAVFAVSFAYPEIYCWFDAFCYAMYMGTTFVTVAELIWYFNGGGKKHAIIGTVVGMINCVSLPNCVPVGLTILVLWWVKPLGEDLTGKPFRRGKDLIPLALFIASAMTNVLAPGNFSRLDNYDRGISLGGAFANALHFMVYRAAKCFTNISVIIGLLLMVVIAIVVSKKIGSNYVVKKSVTKLVITLALVMIAILGAIFPVALGYSSWYMPNRICFVFDSMFIPTACIAAFDLGGIIGRIIPNLEELLPRFKVVAAIMAANFIMFSCCNQGSPWHIGLFHAQEVCAERSAWIEIMEEIEESDEECVIISSKPVEKTGLYEDIGINEEGAWPNSTIAYYLGKEDVLIHWDEAGQ